MRKMISVIATVCLTGLASGVASAGTPGADVRVTNDITPPGYVSAYTLASGTPYTDATLAECSRARGRQNEPAIAVDPRNTTVVLGSSNDYCGVYNASDPEGNPVPAGPIWLGYYRSENAGASFVSSLVPGYPDDASPYAALARIRTASAGDPVIAWDAQGRAFFGSESSDDPAGSAKTFGDVWVARFENPAGPGGPTINDGKAYRGTTLVARGSSAPNLLGKFNDKTALEADHNSDGRCDNDVYFAYSRFTGNGGVAIQFSRSTDHGVTFSHPAKLSQTISDVQFADIAVTGSSNVYVVFRSFASGRGPEGNAVYYVRSTDCGATFSRPQLLTTFVPYDAQDVSDPEAVPAQAQPDDPAREEAEAPEEGRARDCGDFDAHCRSGYTFFRRDTQVRATGDQFDRTRPDLVYVVYDPTKPGTEVATGTTYGSIQPGTGSQSAIYFLRLDGGTGALTPPSLLDPQTVGHQLFPDISADGGVLHTIWWDSRNDPCYSPTRPVGNCADRTTVPSLDAYGASSTDLGANWTRQRVSDVTSNPNYEQFSDRTLPFAGDYLYVSSLGQFSYGVWTDWRNTVAGTDPREAPEDEDRATADVLQCRVLVGGLWSGDRCPRNGGLDQNIYGDQTP
jgi:hypothetical protein